MRTERTSVPMHGVYYRTEDDLSWWQYWHGVKHVWYWHGVPVWWVLRKRNRPMHELTRLISGGW